MAEAVPWIRLCRGKRSGRWRNCRAASEVGL